MKLLRRLYPHLFLQGAVVTIGNFDGVHLGHQALIRQLVAVAQQRKQSCVVILFEPQPSEYFNSSFAPARLMTLRDKLVQFKQLGVDYVCCLPFNQHLAQMDAEEFVKKYIFSAFNVSYLLVGKDFRFGANRSGDIHQLKDMARTALVDFDVFENYLVSGQRVSSTAVRHALHQGDFALAKMQLGRPYTLSGRVYYGQGLARKLGVPTANVCLRHVRVPTTGVFCVRVIRKNGQQLKGVANLGYRPTVETRINPTLEVHLFDFNQMIYGEFLQIIFLKKIRDEQKFASLEALKKQIQSDIETRMAFFVATNE